VMNPVTARKFTGEWTPPLKDVDIQLAAENQATSTSVVYVIELKKQDNTALIVSDVGANTFSKVIKLDPNTFSLAYGPQLGQYTDSPTAKPNSRQLPRLSCPAPAIQTKPTAGRASPTTR